MDLTVSDDWDFARFRAISALEDEWRDNRDSPKRWDILRRAYALQLPEIMEQRALGKRARTNPYFLDWDFTPIEYSAWAAIRGFGLPFYPQFPAQGYFLDFADPYFKIGVELDGKQYHDAQRDRARDEVLWRVGWRMFRIPGRITLPLKLHGERIDGLDPDCSEENFDEWLWGTDEGVMWSLGLVYYDFRCRFPDQTRTAEVVLRGHRYVQFPLYWDRPNAED